MAVEYEATFLEVDKDDVRKRLKKAGADLIKPEFLQKRFIFSLPKGHEIEGAWLRVRNEGDKITMSLKIVDGNKIEDQKEVCLTINDFETGREFLESIGCQRKSYQETKREIWELDGVEICIDEWPFLEPYVEVEGKTEKEVKIVSEKLGFDYSTAWFCACSAIYNKKYGIPEKDVNGKIPKIVFDMENPFLKYNKK